MVESMWAMDCLLVYSFLEYKNLAFSLSIGYKCVILIFLGWNDLWIKSVGWMSLRFGNLA